MLDLLFLVTLSAWSVVAGLWLLRRFGPVPENRWDAVALAVPLGLGALGLAALGLGEFGRLDGRHLGQFLVAVGVIGLPGAMRWLRVWSRTPDEARPAAEWPDRAFGVVLAAGLVGTLLTALAPVTDGDALCYHLQVPKRFLARGGVFFDPDLHETVYPLLTEMVYAVALAFRGPVACRLVQWLLGVAFALNVTAMARPSLGRRAWWAGALALLVPAVSNGMSAPLNDVALAAFGVAALHAWSRFLDRPGLRAAALTGVFTGLATGVKYPALVLAGLIGLSVSPGLFSRVFYRLTTGGSVVTRRWAARLVARLASDDRAERPRKRFTHLAAYATCALAVGGCWYVRALVHTGNPVHPFFRSTFGGSGLDEVLGAEKRPMPVDPWHVLGAIGPLTLRPDTFDSVSHEFGPVFLLFLPALLWERPPRRVLRVAAVGYAFLAVCLTQRQSMRFVLTAVGPLSVAVAWLASAWWERRTVPSRVLVAALLLAVGFESTLAVARARHGLGAVVGLESAGAYLERREPTYRVGRWVDANLPSDARIVGQDHRGYYFPRDYAMELAHRRRTGLGRRGESPAGVVAELRRAGFTHLLLCPPEPLDAVEFDPTLGRLLAPWLESREPVYREAIADADGVTRNYAIYPLADDRLADAGGARR